MNVWITTAPAWQVLGEATESTGDVTPACEALATCLACYENESTSSAFIMTDKQDNQITGFYPGAMANSVNYSLKDLKQKTGLA